ncbi:MAG: hypothetical protein NTW50_02040 [Candidatus Berkelbacteria bacterium]|nr:hypothetical protein [Candidatus Berkelbacteria bacterium]
MKTILFGIALILWAHANHPAGSGWATAGLVLVGLELVVSAIDQTVKKFQKK